MLRLIQFLILGHVHQWETVKTGTLWEENRTRASGLWFHERCTSCGVNRYKKSTGDDW